MDVDPNSIEHLILEGAAEVAGIDLESGEMMYTFTSKIQDVNPRLYEEINQYVENSILSMWEKDFVEIDLFSEEPRIRVTEKAFDKESLEELDQKELTVLKNIIRIFDEEKSV